jgi:hypothetical protein
MKISMMLIIPLVLLSHVASAKNTQKSSQEDMEVIQIIGQFSAAKWGQIAEQAKVDFYELFNQLNTIEKFRMVCRVEKTIGSNIKRNVCEPMFFKHAMFNRTQNDINNGSTNNGSIRISSAPNSDDILFLTTSTKEAANAHMEQLIMEHPDLREKFSFYAKAKKSAEIRAQMNN